MRKKIFALSAAVSSVFGVGYVPYISGTAGSVVGLLLVFFLPSQNLLFAGSLFVAAVVLSPVVYAAEKYYGVYDDGRIVIDEVVGCMIACALLPKTPLLMISAFVLFRVFDIVKPGIIKTSQEIPYGFGVMVDDVLAGISANLCVQVLNLAIKYFA